jgi:flagellar motor component MotA
MLRIFGFIILVVSLMAGVMAPGTMYHQPSLLMTIGGVVAALLFRRQRLGNMVGAVFMARTSHDDLAAAAEAWRLAFVFALVVGAIGASLRFVMLVSGAGELSAIGPELSIGLLNVFYGVLLSFAIALPLGSRLEDRAG